MKKSQLFITASLFFSFFFIACAGDTTSYYEGSSKLDKPVVTAKAWPGVNIITWTAVPAAASYNIYRNGNTPVNTTALAYSDINVVNGQQYKYTIEAVFSLKSEANVIGTAETVYLNGIRPPAGTAEDTALNLAAYEGGTDGSTRKSADQSDLRYLSPANIKGYAGNGVLYAEFPAKPYLKYSVEAVLQGDAAYSGSTVMQDLFLSDLNYGLGGTVLPILKGGKWDIKITAEALNPIYRKSAAVTAAVPISIESILIAGNPVAATASLTSVYTSASNARLIWTPADDESGNAYGTECYSVFRQSVATDGTKSWNLVSGTVTAASLNAGGSPVTYYWIDDAGASSTADLNYALVLSKDYKYGNSVLASLPVYAGSSLALSLTAPASWTAATPANGQISVNIGTRAAGDAYSVSYTSYAGSASDDAYLAANTISAAAWTDVTLTETDETAAGATTKTFVVKGTTTESLPKGTYLFRLVVRNGNKKQINYQIISG